MGSMDLSDRMGLVVYSVQWVGTVVEPPASSTFTC